MRYESNNQLYHYGIPKMSWGKRRYQNYDGTLTPEGRERYRKGGSGASSSGNSGKAGSGVRRKGSD